MQLRRFAIVLLVGATAGTLTGCATSLTQGAMNVKDADTALVERCRYIGDVMGSSGWGNLAASTGMRNAKNEAREEAAEMGATHVVWSSVSGGYSPSATGRAYNCLNP